MKILVLSNDYNVPVWGNSAGAIHLRGISRGFSKARHQVLLVARRFEPNGSLPGSPGFECIEIPGRPDLGHGFSPRLMNERLHRWLVRLHKRFPYSMIYERSSLWTTAGLDAALELGVRHVLEVNTLVTREAFRRRNPPLAGEAVMAERSLVRRADRIVAASEAIARDLKWLGGRTASILHEANGVEPECLLLEKPARDPGAPFTIGFAGSLKPWQGLSTLIEAFDRVGGAGEGFLLRIIGDGPLRELVQDAVAKGNGVSWAGSMSHVATLEEIRRFDVGAAPYVADLESPLSPLKIAEYQALGVPVVASGGGGIMEAISPGTSGILFPCGDAGALARAIRSLRDDPVFASKLASGGRKRMRNRSWQKIAARIARAVPRVREQPAATVAGHLYLSSAVPAIALAAGSDRSRS